MVHGDVDLTENLDFYHDKPVDKKHLPAIPWKHTGITLTEGTTYEVTTAVNNEYHPDYGWTYNITYDNNTIEITDWNYTTNLDFSSTYITYRQPITVTYTSSVPTNYTVYSTEDGTTSENFWRRMASVTYDGHIDDNYWYYDDEASYSYSPNIYDLKPKRQERLKSRPKHEVESALKHCSRCGESRLGKCRCAKEDKITITGIIRNSRNLKRNRQIEKDDLADDCFYLFKQRRKQEDKKSWKREIKIPWLSKLNYRMYEDYMEELKEGEKDYSSYLTNMSWIGIH